MVEKAVIEESFQKGGRSEQYQRMQADFPTYYFVSIYPGYIPKQSP